MKLLTQLASDVLWFGGIVDCYGEHACLFRQISGEVDQSAGMLDEGAREKGYALLCVAEPKSDCKVQTITEVSGLETKGHFAS